ncbi:hypothetical protein PsorP6_001182 [Peronosclerospora sorghi]|uniref:Uncharacterized protein n=1 Tax=Peronosclerospora sorghi TaxID=230839 RepID=A0ACC0WS57_9STRA|nr:hypothetical protein PsorP6_001182 [Peronosclerospora sorghi]
MNINGFNKPPIGFLKQFFSVFTFITLQETKFNSSDSVRHVSNFVNVSDSKADSFSLTSPRRNFRPDTDRADSSPRFFDELPPEFLQEGAHVVLGDINVPIDATLDKRNPYPHDLGSQELLRWQMRLGVIDALRTWYPDRREFTGQGNLNRIDYCFLSPTLFSDSLRGITHVTDRKYHHEDHTPIRVHLKSPNGPSTAPLPWKCPRWYLENLVVRKVLDFNLDCLGKKLRRDANANPGALLDEHNRDDVILIKK